MIPAARIEAAIELTEKIWASRVPMDKTAGDYFRQRRHIGSKDRAEVAERVYSMMRHHARLNWWMERLNVQGVRARMLLHMALVETMSLERIDQLCSGQKYAPEALSEQEHEILSGIEGLPIDHADMPAAVRVECPPEAEAALRVRFGDDFEARMVEMLTPAPLDLRVNTVLIDRPNAKASLEKDGVNTTETNLSPWGLRVLGKAYLATTKAFHKGFIEIQDEGSQMIALLCAAKPGEQILDYCAGAGGKTLALAASMESKGRIVAMDMSAERLEKGRVRYRKAGVHNIEVRPLSDEKQQKWLRRQKDKFDCVLVDVPCSSSGTWRRNPDLRWRQYGPVVADLIKVQAEITDKVAPYVKPGGRLVYATCSLNPAENEEQVNAFLARNDEFTQGQVMAHNGFFACVMTRKQLT